MGQLLLTTSEHSSCRDLASSPGGPTPGGRGAEASLLVWEEFLLDFPTNPPCPGSLVLTSTEVQLVQTAIPGPHACLAQTREDKPAQVWQIWDRSEGVRIPQDCPPAVTQAVSPALELSPRLLWCH